MDLPELVLDDESVEAIERAKSVDEIRKILHARGIEANMEDIQGIFNPAPHEMAEKELENVTGGGVVSSIWNYINALRYKAGGGGFSNGGGGNGGFVGGVSGSR